MRPATGTSPPIRAIGSKYQYKWSGVGNPLRACDLRGQAIPDDAWGERGHVAMAKTLLSILHISGYTGVIDQRLIEPAATIVPKPFTREPLLSNREVVSAECEQLSA